MKIQFGSPVQYRSGNDSEEPFASQREDGWFLGRNNQVKTGGWIWTGTKARHYNNVRPKIYTNDDKSLMRPKGLTMIKGASVEGEEIGNPVDILECQDNNEEVMFSPISEDFMICDTRSFDDVDDDCMIANPAMYTATTQSELTPLQNLGPDAPPLFTAGEKPDEKATAVIVANKDVMTSQGMVRNEWIEAAHKELQSIVDLNVFEEHTNDSIKPVINRYRKEGVTPEFLPSSVVWNIKPEKPPEFRKRYKARLCVAGNLSKVFGESYTPTLDSCFAKLILKLAVTMNWTLAVTDIKTAFLHAPMPDNRCVVVRPPAGMVRLGLVKPDSLWKLKKALYGLRECPRLWAQERDKQLKTMKWTCEKNGVTTQIGMTNNIVDPTLWTIVSLETGSMMGMLATYVDDVLFAGPPEIVEGGLAALSKIWACDEPIIMPPDKISEAV